MLFASEREHLLPDGGLLCITKSSDPQLERRRLFISKTDKRRCDENYDCRDGGDEVDCKKLADQTLYPSITATLAACVASVVAEIIVKCTKRKKSKTIERIRRPEAEDIVDRIMRHILQIGTETTNEEELSDIRRQDEQGIANQYRKLHDTVSGGIRLLSGSGFCLLSTPNERHNLAKFIWTEENKIHKSEEEVRQCLRRKGCSSKEMAICLDHIEPPGCWKKLKYKVVEQPMNWFLKNNKSLAFILIAALPVLKITMYMYDFSKDSALVFYLAYYR